MLKPVLVLGYLLLPALAILVSARATLERRLLWALGSIASGLVLLAASLLTPHVGAGWLAPGARGSLGLLLLSLSAIAPWLVFAAFRRATTHALPTTYR